MITKDMASSVALTVGAGFAEMTPDVLAFAQFALTQLDENLKRPTNLEIVKYLREHDDIGVTITTTGLEVFYWRE